MKHINREILAIAIPSIVTNITTPLLALMDVVIVGHMGSAVYIAAIAVGGTIFNMLYWLFAFLRMGSSGMTAIANGASDSEGCSAVLFRGLCVAFTASLLILLFQKPLLSLSLKMLEVDDTIKNLVEVYFNILIWGAPASLSTFVITGWFLGLKNARLPMIISFIINVSNILVSLILVYKFHLKIEGVAAGTLCAQWLGFIAGVSFTKRKYHIQTPPMRQLLETAGLRRFFSVNTDIFFRTLCLIVVTVWFTRIGSTQGNVILAVNTLLMQFFILFSYFMDGFAFAGESLTGNYVGSRDKEMLKLCIRSLFKWSIIMVVCFTILYYICGKFIMSLLSNDTDVIISAREYYNWVIAIPAVGFAAFTWDGVFIGATRTREMLLSMSIATIVYFLVFRLTFDYMGNHGLWLAFLSYLTTRGLLLTFLRQKLFNF